MSEIVRKEDIPEVWQFQVSLSDHPILRDEQGVLRYQETGVNDWLWQFNEMRVVYAATRARPLKEHMQLFRDMGYSLSGFSEVFADELEELEKGQEYAE